MPAPNFHPLQTTRLRDSAASQIQTVIESGALKVGEWLPSERDLSTLLGVSRTSVREAIRVLESMGLIEVRHGRGSVVRRSSAWGKLWAAWGSAHATRLFQLYDVREAMETKAAELAAEQARPEEIAGLRRSLAEFRTAVAIVPANLEAIVSADTAFHSHLVRASRNPFLIEAVESLHEALADDRRAVFTINRRDEKSAREHEQIVAAVEGRNPEAARRAIRRHFRSVVGDFKRALTDGGRA